MWNTNFKATMFQAKYFYMYSANQLKNSMCQHYYYPLFLCLGQCKQKKYLPIVTDQVVVELRYGPNKACMFLNTGL